MVIKRADERKVVYTEEEIGKCKCVSFLNEDESFGAGNFFGVCTMVPGDKTKYHLHTTEYEVYHILSGEATYYQDDKEYDLKAGDTTLCPVGSSHSIKNTGNEDLVFVALMLYPKN